MKKTIEFIVKGGEVKRFHTIRTIQEETVGHHSFLVASLVSILVPYGARLDKMLLAALRHDLAEQVVGDIPGNTKKLMDQEGRVGEREENLLVEVGLSTPLSEEEERIIKLADCLAGYIFCDREEKMGNTLILSVRANYRAYIKNLEPFSDRERAVVSAVIN